MPICPGSPPDLAVGDRLEPGDVIGYVGNTGYGPVGHQDEFTYHLHVGIQEPDGGWINPHPLLEDLYQRAVEQQR